MQCKQLKPTVSKLCTIDLDDVEKEKIWLGHKLQEQILSFETRAYHEAKTPSVEFFKARFNQSVVRDVKALIYRLSKEEMREEFQI